MATRLAQYRNEIRHAMLAALSDHGRERRVEGAPGALELALLTGPEKDAHDTFDSPDAAHRVANAGQSVDSPARAVTDVVAA